MKKNAIDLDSVMDRVRASGGAIHDWYSGLDPAVQKTLIGGAVGAGTGATLLGLRRALSEKDPDERSGVTGKALTGALLGGLAGSAIPLGLSMFHGDIKAPGEPEPGAISSAVSGTVNGSLRHWPTMLGGALGGTAMARKYKGLIGGLMQGPSAGHVENYILSRIKDGTMSMQDALSVLNDHGINGISGLSNAKASQLRNVFGGVGKKKGLTGSVRYGDLTKRIFHSKGKIFKYLRRPSLHGLTNIKDPRVKLLATVLGGLGVGGAIEHSMRS